MQGDINLKQTPVGNVAGNLNELKNLAGFVQLEEAILRGGLLKPVEGTQPDLD